MNKAQYWVDRFNKERPEDSFDEFMVFEVEGGFVSEEYEIVHDEQIGQSRWGVILEKVFKFRDGSYMELTYEKGATENQEDHPKSYEALEVEPYEKTVVKYRKK